MVGNLHKILCCNFTKLRFLPARRYASAGTSYGPVSVCLSVCLSVTSRCSIETAKRIGMVLARMFPSTYYTACCNEM